MTRALRPRPGPTRSSPFLLSSSFGYYAYLAPVLLAACCCLRPFAAGATRPPASTTCLAYFRRGHNARTCSNSSKGRTPSALLQRIGRGGGASSDDNADDDEGWDDDDATIISPYEYTPPSALDAYGGSPQIRNAARAAEGAGGTIVVAAVATAGPGNDEAKGGGENSGVVCCCSLHRRRAGVRRSRPTEDDGSSSVASGRAMHVVSSTTAVPYEDGTEQERGRADTNSSVGAAPSDGGGSNDAAIGGDLDANGVDHHHNSIVTLAASGLRADLTLLLTLLRSHSVSTWDRYDVPPNPARVAGAAGEVFLTFLGYDRRREVGDGVGPVAAGAGGGEGGGGGDGENGFRMARPFGLHAMVMGVGWEDRSDGRGGDAGRGASIRTVGPSGVCHGPYVARAVGRGSDAANDLLEERWRLGMNVDEIRELCFDVVREVAREAMGLGKEEEEEGRFGGGNYGGEDGGDNDSWEVVCETLSAGRGIEVRRVPLFVSADKR